MECSRPTIHSIFLAEHILDIFGNIFEPTIYQLDIFGRQSGGELTHLLYSLKKTGLGIGSQL